jgi:DNA sulfur modification protein DndD
MKIKSLELRNFRPYYGDVKIAFPTSNEAPVCLIHGSNGFGKTSLLFALNWCLYGHDKLRDAFEYFNLRARSEASPTMSVKIVFDEGGNETSILRRIQCNKPVNTVRDLSNSELVIFENGKRRQTSDEQILQEIINDKLPREASQFSFFDGEKIEIYSSNDATEETQKAIVSVLGISLLSRSKEDLEGLGIQIDRDRRRLLEREESGKALADEMANLDANIEEAKKQKSDLEAQCRYLQSQELSLQDQLVSQESAKNLIMDIERLESKIEELKNTKDSVASEIKEATRTLYLDILEPVLVDQLAEAQRRRDNLLTAHIGTVRSEAAQHLLHKIEQSGTCICGRPTDLQHLQVIREMLELTENPIPETSNSNDLDLYKQLVSELEASLAKTRNRVSYAELAARLALIENEQDEQETSLMAKKNQLGSTDQETINSLSEAQDRVKKEKGQAEREIGSLEKTISDYLGERRVIENKIAKISGQVQGLDLLTTQVQLLNRSAEAFGEIVRRSAVAKQQEIQDASTNFFREITNKTFGYERMIINEDFSFGVETALGTRPPMNMISAGESQVTALSFILGLNEYTRHKAPIFMDTPMGRLDQTHRRNVAKVLLELAKNDRQIILLVTDTDVEFGVYNMLKPAIGAEYEIVHDQANLTSSLKRRQQ